MPASIYLSGADLATYGVSTIPPVTIMRASALIDNYLKRPEGCLWTPDKNGIPAYMTALDPIMTLTAQGPILAGAAVSVSIPGYTPDDTVMGEAVVLDRASTTLMETAWVQSYSPGAIVLKTVVNDHPGPVTIDFGMTITAQKNQPSERSIVMLDQWPIQKIVSGVGRYGYGRRSDQMLGYFNDVNLLSMFTTFGGPPVWEPFEIQASSVNPLTGTVWVPAGVLLSYFTEVKMRYIGGWQATALPAPIKIACAMLSDAINDQGMGPNVRRFSTGKVDIQKFASTVVDEDIKNTLRPYRATVLG